MKKIYTVLVALLLCMSVLFTGCKGDEKPSEPDNVTSVPEPTDIPVPSDTAVITDAPQPTTDSEVTDTPQPTSEPEIPIDANSYELLLGTWYLYSSEIEGYESLAVDEYTNEYVVINEDYTTENVREWYFGEPGYDPEIYEYSGTISDVGDENWLGRWYADYGIPDVEDYFSINEEGNLIRQSYITYDEGLSSAISYSVFLRERQYFPPEPPVVPECLQTIMDGAGEDIPVTVILDPSSEISEACDEAGWELQDESDNEWLTYKMVSPTEMIVCNTSDRLLLIEIHEPEFSYDPASDDTEWVAGPFMYYSEMKPGEISRFIVNMPENAVDATMALYMFFDDWDSEPCYKRIYRYEDCYLNLGDCEK